MAREKSRISNVRTVYLYVATLVGLGLLIGGAVNTLELILKSTLLTEADMEEKMWAMQPPMPYAIDRIRSAADSIDLTEQEREMFLQWIQDYERWNTQQQTLDVVKARRQRQFASALALLLVGAPVYLYHWMTIKKEPGPVAVSDSGG